MTNRATMRRTTTRTALAAAVATLCVVLTACGSSGKASGTASSTPASVTASPDATTLAAITTAYQTFFAPGSSDAQIAGAVQNGETLVVPAQSEDHSQYEGKSGVTVDKVVMQSAHVAKVTFTVTIDGSPMLPGASGYAVNDAGSWKMAATTFCELVTLEGTAPESCKDPKQTALPTE